MNFVSDILSRANRTQRPVLQEVREGEVTGVTGVELAAMVSKARAVLRSAGLQKGDRCALLANNSIRWAALDLAMMAEGLIVVPLYARQSPKELVGMMKDCGPARIYCGDQALANAIRKEWVEAPRTHIFDEVFYSNEAGPSDAVELKDDDPVTIIYTSGTSGEPKGVVLNVANLNQHAWLHECPA